jgi:cold shock CspA family protein
MRQIGIVLLFRVDRGYGFVRTEGGSSLFFHVNEVRDRLILETGDRVEFEAGPSLKSPGKIECTNVVLLERAPKAVKS